MGLEASQDLNSIVSVDRRAEPFISVLQYISQSGEITRLITIPYIHLDGNLLSIFGVQNCHNLNKTIASWASGGCYFGVDALHLLVVCVRMLTVPS